MSEIRLFEFWDIGEEGKIPNLTASSCGKILQAVIKFGGKFKDWHVQGLRSDPDRTCLVCYRIILPHGQKEAFELATGYTLTRSENVGGQ
jgi:hypothetical protein